MVHSLVKKEFLNGMRDRSFVVLGIIFIILLFVSLASSRKTFQKTENERAYVQKLVEEQWDGQPDRHPHRVAHYGSFIFKPKQSLSFFDPGLNSYTGNFIYLEAHKQNSSNFGIAEQSTSLIRFGEMSPAMVIQLLIPLLLIFLAYRAFTGEREGGTLKLLLTQGLTYKKIAWQKILGFGLLTYLLLGIGFILALPFIHEGGESNDFLRTLLLFLFYTLYLFIILSAVVIVSARCLKSSDSLMILLGAWICFCLIIPKLSANLGAHLYPAPTKAQMDAAIHAEVSKAMDGHNSKDKKADDFKQELLKKYNVQSVEELPLNLDGLIMAEGERQSAEVYKKHFAELNATFDKQNSISSVVSLINPFLAIRSLSMALTGSDFFHYVDFLNQTENYRYGFVQWLNDLQAKKLKYGDKTFRLPKETWSEYPSFEYTLPTIASILRQQILPLISLVGWFFIIIIFGMGLVQRKEEV